MPTKIREKRCSLCDVDLRPLKRIRVPSGKYYCFPCYTNARLTRASLADLTPYLQPPQPKSRAKSRRSALPRPIPLPEETLELIPVARPPIPQLETATHGPIPEKWAFAAILVCATLAGVWVFSQPTASATRSPSAFTHVRDSAAAQLPASARQAKAQISNDTDKTTATHPATRPTALTQTELHQIRDRLLAIGKQGEICERIAAQCDQQIRTVQSLSQSASAPSSNPATENATLAQASAQAQRLLDQQKKQNDELAALVQQLLPVMKKDEQTVVAVARDLVNDTSAPVGARLYLKHLFQVESVQ
ncbi:MAG TPA: hypothetical protein VF669_08620 [Tepidisphaeraceae bacterium]|jgi:hypothetical protein